jgi:hypothetical protein
VFDLALATGATAVVALVLETGVVASTATGLTAAAAGAAGFAAGEDGTAGEDETAGEHGGESAMSAMLVSLAARRATLANVSLIAAGSTVAAVSPFSSGPASSTSSTGGRCASSSSSGGFRGGMNPSLLNPNWSVDDTDLSELSSVTSCAPLPPAQP